MGESKVKKVAGWSVARLGEASTWKGIGWLMVAAGVLPVGAVDGLAAVGLGLVGLVEMVRKEIK